MTILSLTWYEWIELLLLVSVVFALIKPLGTYIARVYNGQFTFLTPVFYPIEERFYKIIGIQQNKEMRWTEYAYAILISSFIGFLLLFGILRLQAYLPFNPQHFPNLPNDLAFNIAVSFLTNTNWQSYGGEFTLSYFSQMMGLTVQNFLSASMGMAVAIAFIRGLARKNSECIGHYWIDWTRGCLYILLPLSLLLAILLGSQGVIQNINAYLITAPLQPSEATQIIPGGPVASQVAIKIVGGNGGGFFNVNAAHPFENPTALSNFFELIAIFLIPTALCYAFGILINNKKQGWILLMAMAIIFFPLFFFSLYQEKTFLPHLPAEVEQTGNMEGKEVRLGVFHSTLWASAATATANGSTNSMHDSYTPLGGMVFLVFILFGEIIFGGMGSGLYTMLIFVYIAVFIAGLMVGRTPEFLGKKIQSFEMKTSLLVILIPMFFLLLGLTIATLSTAGKEGIFNPGGQGFTEMLYAFSSAAMHNGSAFAGIRANTPFYNTVLGFVMLLTRYWVMICVLAIGGSLAKKNIAPINESCLSTNNVFFLLFLISVILLIGPLTYIPAVVLGPISEYFEWMRL